MPISKQTWEKIVFAILVAITVGIAKKIYRRLHSPTNYIFLALVNFFYSIFVFLLLMSFVASRIKVIADTLPQFRILRASWVVIPFTIVSFIFIYLFLIMLLKWYFEKKPLAEVADSLIKPIGKGAKAIKDAVVASVKVGTVGTQKAVKKTVDGASVVTKVTTKGFRKTGSAIKKIVSTLTRKPIHQNPEQENDSGVEAMKE